MGLLKINSVRLHFLADRKIEGRSGAFYAPRNRNEHQT